MIVGLTGGFATGKSTVTEMFKKLGAKTISSDEIAHAMLKEPTCFKKITKTFGSDVLVGNEVNRKKLANIVFKSPKKLRQLEKILHPAVRKETYNQIKKYQKQDPRSIIILDVPLLFEVKFDQMADTTIVVVAPLKDQIKRAQNKFGLKKHQVLDRIKRQMPLKDKSARADIIIDNSKTLLKTQNEVKKVWQRLLLRQRS